MKTITLYRPVGEKELVLIANADFKEYSPRLDWQPIFYPVLYKDYAAEIASKWNTVDDFGNYLGFVTQFKITEEEFNRHRIECVGAQQHEELWVKSEELTRFNSEIVGKIEVIDVFIGDKYKKSKFKIVNELINQLKKK
mgnify:CR=1 FL=1